MGHRQLLTGAAALHFVVSSVVVVNGHLGMCWHFCVLYKGKKNSVFFAFLPYDCVLLTKVCPFIELFFGFVFVF